MKFKFLKLAVPTFLVLTFVFATAFNTSAQQRNTLDAPSSFQNDGVAPRTLEALVKHEQTYWDYLKANHPVFKYARSGRLVGDLHLSDRMEEFIDFGGALSYNEAKGLTGPTAVTYRLAMESVLDYPNKFVGPKKCGECHPAQYTAWEKSRHAKTLRFPDEIEEVGGDMKKILYPNAPKASILPEGVDAEDVLFIVGTPRTKYGFLDKWLVRGTFHVEDGDYGDGTGKIVAGSNQFSRFFAENLTPELVAKINAIYPSFPTKLEDMGPQTSDVWGMTSYGSQHEAKFMFQPGTSYCETCHAWKFNFKTNEEFIDALGDREKLRKATISKGISCEECHGAGAHLYGARGAGMPSNCERCHQRFSFNQEDYEKNPEKEFNVYFKSACPSCGTEGGQMYSSAHYDKGMRCSTCHDPHAVTANDWKTQYTKTVLKQDCEDCHEVQKSFFKTGGIHAKDNCTGCHMPNMMSCENFSGIQQPDAAGFDNVRASHIWKIKVDKEAKTINPPAGKDRDPINTKGWMLDRDDDGYFFLDLMWSCGRTSYSDINLIGPGAAGCHSPFQSTLPDDLKYTNQAQIYDDVMIWQTPVKTGYAQLQEGLKQISKELADSKRLSVEVKSEILLLAKEAQSISDLLLEDGSWGVHGPKYSEDLVNQGLVHVELALKKLGVKFKR